MWLAVKEDLGCFQPVPLLATFRDQTCLRYNTNPIDYHASKWDEIHTFTPGFLNYYTKGPLA